MTGDVRALSARTYPLAVGTFAVGTSAYCIAGLIPDLALHLRVSVSTAGLLVTVFAWTCVATGVLVTSVTQRVDRRRLLVGALVVVGAGNGAAMLAPAYGWMVAARVVAAIGTAVYTPAAMAMAARLNSAELRARALAVVFGGLTAALIVGVPLSSALSGKIGFRWVFFGLALGCVAAAAIVDVVVPRVPTPKATALRARLGDRQVRVVLVGTVLAATAMFSVYTYLAPVLTQVSGADGTTVSLLLAGYGIGAAVGTVLGGWAADRFGPRRPLLCALSACVVLLAILPVTAVTVPGAAIILAAWGAAFWSIIAPLNIWLISISPADPALVLSLNHNGIYLGTGAGGALGATVIAWTGTSWLAPLSAALSAAALLVVSIAARDGPQPAATAHTVSSLRPGS